MNFAGKIEFYRADDSCLIVEYEGYDDPGKTTGPWEDCYPQDSEMSILSIKQDGKDVEVSDEEMERIEQVCWDDVTETVATQSEAEYYAELNRGYAQDRA